MLCSVAFAQVSFEEVSARASAEREAGDTKSAIRDYQSAVGLRPEWVEGWWYLGTMQYERNEFVEAGASFGQMVKLMPGMGAAWNFLGLCEFEMRAYDGAREHLEKGNDLGSAEYPEIARVAVYHLALLRIRSGEFESASQLLRASFPGERVPEQIQQAMGLAVLHVALLPSEVDPSHDALIHEVGGAAVRMTRGDAAGAADALRDLAKRNPDAPRLQRAYAAALRAANRETEATQEERAAGTVPDSQVRQWYRSRVETSSQIDSDQNAWQKAMAAFSGGRYLEASAGLKEWLRSRPNDGTGWAVLGLSEFETKEYDNALLHLERGRELGFGGNAESVQLANYRLSELLVRSGQFEKATSVLVSRVEVAGHSAEIRRLLGMCLLRIAAFPEGLDPAISPVVEKAGETSELLHTSQYDRAFTNFQEMLKAAPTLPFLHYAYGTALIAMSRYDEAKEQMLEEIRTSPKSEPPYLRLASIAIRQHSAKDAVEPAQQALKIQPESGEAHYLLGRAWLEMERDEEAMRELEIAGRISPNSPEIHFNLAKAYTRMKRLDDAQRERALFLQLNSLAEQQRNAGEFHGPREAIDLPANSPH